ncbi:Os10g0388700 [Oryza sativa Japonica Group]|uniref:Os10g0388700 protein n=1 Tax=Oryza sativa subsp. japonica TaxID=39947 RepID=A0A0P0XTU6_ORYSJ|nr:Os10g0388700 [Oryza sativa Japonica Group]
MARRRRRGCGASASTSTPLIPVGVDKAPNIDPNLYFVAITGIKVASGEIVSDKAAAIMTTVSTLYTFLNPVLFDHLKKQLPPLADKGSSIQTFSHSMRYRLRHLVVDGSGRSVAGGGDAARGPAPLRLRASRLPWSVPRWSVGRQAGARRQLVTAAPHRRAAAAGAWRRAPRGDAGCAERPSRQGADGAVRACAAAEG